MAGFQYVYSAVQALRKELGSKPKDDKMKAARKELSKIINTELNGKFFRCSKIFFAALKKMIEDREQWIVARRMLLCLPWGPHHPFVWGVLLPEDKLVRIVNARMLATN